LETVAQEKLCAHRLNNWREHCSQGSPENYKEQEVRLDCCDNVCDYPASPKAAVGNKYEVLATSFS